MFANLDPSCPDITGVAIITPDLDHKMHTVIISVDEPHVLDSQCADDASPCLANGALTILLDDEDITSPGEVTLGRGMSVGAVNLPGACRPFGFEKYWARKVLEAEQAAGAGRRLEEVTAVSMAEWVLSDALATNKPECESWVDSGDLFDHQSEHASFQLNTPSFAMRLNYGKLHQIAMRDPTDRFDLPDHITHQMNLGLSRTNFGEFPQGVLGQTTRVRMDADGKPIMTGPASIAGVESDYEVDGPLGVSFKASP